MMTTRGQHERTPVNDMQGMEVAKSAGDLSSVEPSSGFQENPLSLEVVEQLHEEIREEQKVNVPTDIVTQIQTLKTTIYIPENTIITSPPLT